MKPTQAQLRLQLGREGTAQSTWLRRVLHSCRSSSPFSLSTRQGHAEEPTNNETHLNHATAHKPRTADSNAATQWQNQLHRKISKDLQLNEEADKITSLKLRADRLKRIRKKLQICQFD